MPLCLRVHITTLSLLAGLLLLGSIAPRSKASESSGTLGSLTNGEVMSQALLQLQQELRATRDGMEVTKRAGDAEARRQAERLSLQLARLEREIETQKEEKQQLLKSVESANQQNLVYAGLFAGVALLAVMGMSFLQLRATSKLTELTLSHFPERFQLPPPSNGRHQVSVPPNPDPEPLLRSVERLERRIQELESTAAPSKMLGFASSAQVEIPEPLAATGKNGGNEVEVSTTAGLGTTRRSVLTAVVEESKSNLGSVMSVMLGKGDALLQLGQAEAALRCFQEALECESGNVDAWVKKGSALEKLDRMEEALSCYDSAIELNGTSTLAYLYKGGVCNRLERFDEALACYEKALKSQERPA